MTSSTLQAKSSTEGTFSYAAAASGKHSPMPSKSSSTAVSTPQAQNSGTTTPNGLDGTAVDQSVPITDVSSLLKATQISKPSAVTTGDVKSMSTTEDVNNTNGKLESDPPVTPSDLTNSKEENTPAEPVKRKLIPAPPPTVNPWKVRAEEFSAKAKFQPVSNTAAVPVSNPQKGSGKPTDKSSDKSHDRRKNGTRTEGTWEADKSKETLYVDRKDSARETRERKKSIDNGRPNGYAVREEGTGASRSARSNKTSVKMIVEESPVPEFPPPLQDASLWPTPETAQDEEKKERERLQKEEKEKEKPTVVRSSGPTKFIPAPFTPQIVHNVPLPVKSARGGRGGRGGASGRGGGGSSPSGDSKVERGEKAERSTGSPPATDTDQGRVNNRGNGFVPRGGYQGSRGGRRTASSGGAANRKSDSPYHSEDSKVAENGVRVNVEAVGESGYTPEPKSAGDNSPYGQEFNPNHQGSRANQYNLYNGQSTYSRPDASVVTSSPEAATTQYSTSRAERGSSGQRGGYRNSRGAHHANAHRGSHGGGHLGAVPGQTFHSQSMSHQQNYNGQGQSYRSFSRGGGLRNQTPPRNYHPSFPATMYGGQGFPMPPYFYDYNGMQAPEDPAREYYNNLLGTIIRQCEYYFSVDNLCKDIYLRRHMDSEGYVSLNLIAGFGQITKLTHNIELLREACVNSPNLHVILTPEGYRVRKASGFESFVLSSGERDSSVPDKPTILDERKHAESFLQAQMSASAPAFQPTLHQQRSLNSVAPPFIPSGGWPIGQNVNAHANGTDLRQDFSDQMIAIERTQSQLSANADEFSPATNGVSSDMAIMPGSDMAEFPDEKIGDVVIVYQKSMLESTHLSPGNSPDIKASNGVSQSPRTGHENRLSKHGVSWIIAGTGDDSIAYTTVHEYYTALKTTALQKRLEGSPNPAKMTILYKFWKHFLPKNFNRKMYEEFKAIALEDAQANNTQCQDFLLQFYELVHENSVPPEFISRDYIHLVQKFAGDESSSGIGKMRSILARSDVKDNVKSNLIGHAAPELRQRLQGEGNH